VLAQGGSRKQLRYRRKPQQAGPKTLLRKTAGGGASQAATNKYTAFKPVLIWLADRPLQQQQFKHQSRTGLNLYGTLAPKLFPPQLQPRLHQLHPVFCYIVGSTSSSLQIPVTFPFPTLFTNNFFHVNLLFPVPLFPIYSSCIVLSNLRH
jgi:hypothetical protein